MAKYFEFADGWNHNLTLFLCGAISFLSLFFAGFITWRKDVVSQNEKLAEQQSLLNVGDEFLKFTFKMVNQASVSLAQMNVGNHDSLRFKIPVVTEVWQQMVRDQISNRVLTTNKVLLLDWIKTTEALGGDLTQMKSYNEHLPRFLELHFTHCLNLINWIEMKLERAYIDNNGSLINRRGQLFPLVK